MPDYDMGAKAIYGMGLGLLGSAVATGLGAVRNSIENRAYNDESSYSDGGYRQAYEEALERIHYLEQKLHEHIASDAAMTERADMFYNESQFYHFEMLKAQGQASNLQKELKKLQEASAEKDKKLKKVETDLANKAKKLQETENKYSTEQKNHEHCKKELARGKELMRSLLDIRKDLVDKYSKTVKWYNTVVAAHNRLVDEKKANRAEISDLKEKLNETMELAAKHKLSLSRLQAYTLKYPPRLIKDPEELKKDQEEWKSHFRVFDEDANEIARAVLVNLSFVQSESSETEEKKADTPTASEPAKEGAETTKGAEAAEEGQKGTQQDQDTVRSGSQEASSEGPPKETTSARKVKP